MENNKIVRCIPYAIIVFILLWIVLSIILSTIYEERVRVSDASQELTTDEERLNNFISSLSLSLIHI